MKAQEMLNACCKAITTQVQYGFSPDDAGVQLVIPKGFYPKKFPRGYLLCQTNNGHFVYQFKALKLLNWLAKNWSSDGKGHE